MVGGSKRSRLERNAYAEPQSLDNDSLTWPIRRYGRVSLGISLGGGSFRQKSERRFCQANQSFIGCSEWQDSDLRPPHPERGGAVISRLIPETSPPRHRLQAEFANNPPRRLRRHVEGAPAPSSSIKCGSRIARKRRIGDPALVGIAIGRRAKTVKTTPPGPSGLHRAQQGVQPVSAWILTEAVRCVHENAVG